MNNNHNHGWVPPSKRKPKKGKSVWLDLFIVAYAMAIMVLTGQGVLDKMGQMHALTIGLLIFFLGNPVINAIKSSRNRRKYMNSDIRAIDAMSGEEFELYLKAHFESLGYKVGLTAQSGDYGVDLLCRKGKEKLAVQAKRYKGSVGVDAVQQVVSGMMFYGYNKCMVVTNCHFTKNAVTLAQKDNVELWDRNTLINKFQIR